MQIKLAGNGFYVAEDIPSFYYVMQGDVQRMFYHGIFVFSGLYSFFFANWLKKIRENFDNFFKYIHKTVFYQKYIYYKSSTI